MNIYSLSIPKCERLNNVRFLDAASFCPSNRASTPNPSDATCMEAGSSLSLFCPSSTAQPQQSPKVLNTTKGDDWSNTIPEAVKHPPYLHPFLDASVAPPTKVSGVNDGDVSIMNMSFEDIFVDAQMNDSSFTGTSLPSFSALFASYLEAHEALSTIRSGLYEIPLSDLKDDRGAMGSVTKISELGARVANSDTSTMSPFPGSSDQCCLQLAFLAAVKGCELAEQISIMVLPSTRPPSHPSSMDFAAMTPPDDYSWTTAPPVQSDPPNPALEHIPALVRLDVQLSQLNCFMSKFIQSAPEHMPLAKVLAARCRRRLSYLHSQIRGVVDSMIPAWD